jgi:hypothetical protein
MFPFKKNQVGFVFWNLMDKKNMLKRKVAFNES